MSEKCNSWKTKGAISEFREKVSTEVWNVWFLARLYFIHVFVAIEFCVPQKFLDLNKNCFIVVFCIPKNRTITFNDIWCPKSKMHFTSTFTVERKQKQTTKKGLK